MFKVPFGRTFLWQTCGFALLLFGLAFMSVPTASAAGVITVDIVAGYNLVVDSNVMSPSTYAPSAATVMGRFCNTGDATLNNVLGILATSEPIHPAVTNLVAQGMPVLTPATLTSLPAPAATPSPMWGGN